LRTYKQPVEGYENKFIITEEESYFVPYVDKGNAPRMIEILGEIFDLDDPKVHDEVDGKLLEGSVILGYYDPSNKEIAIHTPLETSEYVEKRLKEIFGEDV
jgi:hypothetical protein